MGAARPTKADLHFAIQRLECEHLMTCLNAGVDPNSVLFGASPLYGAASGKCVEIARLLIEYGADVNEQSSSHNRCMEPMLVFLCRMNIPEIACLILDHDSVRVDAFDFFGYGALYYAASWRNLDLVRKLLDCGANVNVGKVSKANPLRHTIENGKSYNKITRLLIHRGAHVDVNVLKELVRSENFEVFKLAYRARCFGHRRRCGPKKRVLESWANNPKFSQWMETNQVSLDFNPPTLKRITIGWYRHRMVRNWNNIMPEMLHQLRLPDSLKRELLLVE